MTVARLGIHLALLLVVVAPSVAADPESYEVRMHSRTFVPEPSLFEGDVYLRSLPGAVGHLLLQFEDPDDPTAIPALEGFGLRFLTHLPDNTWFTSVPTLALQDPQVTARVRWAAPLVPEDRIHPRLWDLQPGSWAIAGDGRWRLHVRFYRDVDPAAARDGLLGIGAEVVTESPDFRSFEILLPPSGFTALTELDPVWWVRETAPPMMADNDANRQSSGVEGLQNGPPGLDGTSITIAMWDSGNPDPTHPDFADRLILGEVVDVSEHSTHVCGTIAGDGAASQGNGGQSLQWRGMAPGATVVSYDFFDPFDEHADAIQVHGAIVSSNSWSYRVAEVDTTCDLYGDYDFGAPEYDEIVRGIMGSPLTVVHSAGNERDDGDCGLGGYPYDNYGTIPPPGAAKNMITVGAVQADTDAMTFFSSWGPVDDGRVKPDLVGPGCQSSVDYGVTSTAPGGGYDTRCGTSMSTPTVSGAVALLQELALDSTGTVLSPALVKALLLNTARDLGRPGPDYVFGFGALDAGAAAGAVGGSAHGEDVVSIQGEIRDTGVIVDPGQPELRVTLAWSDPAAAPQAPTALINDLDVLLIDPMGFPYLPWTLDPAQPDQPAVEGPNHRDVVEQVTVPNPQPGSWTVRVIASYLPDGPQAYAVAWSSAPPPCAGTILTVPGEFPTIQAAIDSAQSCDTVLVSPGSYGGPLVVTKPIALRGLGRPDLVGSGTERVMTVSANATIEGFRITGGRAAGVDGHGGGILIVDASPVIRGCVFEDNQADGDGGAIAVLSGAPVVEACDFSANTALGSGGAIHLRGTRMASIIGCVIHHNHGQVNGGGIAVTSGSARLDHNTIAFNAADVGGGGVHFSASEPPHSVLDRNIVAHNSAGLGVGGVDCTGDEELSCTCFWDNGSDHALCDVGGDTVFDDPLLCDPDQGDFAIPEYSPCAPLNSPPGCGLIGARDAVEECVQVVGAPLEGGTPTPAVFAVHSARPNPLRGSVAIRVELPESREVRLEIYDVTGRRVRTVVGERLPAGSHVLVWDGRDARGDVSGAGVYFYELRAGDARVAEKLVVLP